MSAKFNDKHILHAAEGEASQLAVNLDSRICHGLKVEITEEQDKLILTPQITSIARQRFDRPYLQDKVISRLLKLAGDMPEGEVTVQTHASRHVLAFDSARSLQAFVHRANSTAKFIHEAKLSKERVFD